MHFGFHFVVLLSPPEFHILPETIPEVGRDNSKCVSITATQFERDNISLDASIIFNRVTKTKKILWLMRNKKSSCPKIAFFQRNMYSEKQMLIWRDETIQLLRNDQQTGPALEEVYRPERGNAENKNSANLVTFQTTLV